MASSSIYFKMETDIVPPTYDKITGELIEPAHAGKQTLEILDSDDEAATNRTMVRIKREDSPRSSSEIRTEGEKEQWTTRDNKRGRDLHKRTHQKTFQSRTPVPQMKARWRSIPSSSSPDPLDDSSDDNCSTPSLNSSSASSLASSDFDSSDDDFKPSRSPSRFPGTPSPNTRSQSRNRQLDTARAKSVPNLRSIEVVIRSRPSNANGSGPSPAGSIRHGWRVVNTRNRAKTPASTYNFSSVGPGSWSGPAATHENNYSRLIRAATAGPSAASYGVHENLLSVQPRQQSLTGTERVIDQDPFVVIEKKQKRDERRDGRPTNKGKGKAVEPEHHEYLTRRPPRQARVEPSIERTPPPGLPTPEPSSARENASCYGTHSPGMFMSSPPQPATPGSSWPSSNRDSNVFEPMSSPSSSSLLRAGIKRRHVEFMDLNSSDDEAGFSNSKEADSLQRRLSKYESRLIEHERKHVRLEKSFKAKVAQFQEEVDMQNARLAEAEANTHAAIEAFESLKQQLEADNTRDREQFDRIQSRLIQLEVARSASNRASQQLRPAVTRHPRQMYPNLDLGRRTGMNPPRPAAIPNTLVRTGSGTSRQRNVMQNRARQEPVESRPPNRDPGSSSSVGSRQGQNSETRRPSTEVAANVNR